MWVHHNFISHRKFVKVYNINMWTCGHRGILCAHSCHHDVKFWIQILCTLVQSYYCCHSACTHTHPLLLVEYTSHNYLATRTLSNVRSVREHQVGEAYECTLEKGE